MKIKHQSDLLLAIAIVGLLFLMIIPLPGMILDLLFTLSIVLSLMSLLLTMYVKSTLDFNSFPSLILFLTLFRLGLNIASTRLILSEGNAGDLIKAFGSFLSGGHLFIGVILFTLVTIINFVVITKGSSRVAEVAARFSLEALPGKQMAIDADLSQGMILQSEGKKARERLKFEAEFYGAMDGASKFVKGDAIVGLLITAVNLFGGVMIGMTVKGLSFSRCMQVYCQLTIGDGLVSQIPALLTSVAAGVIVTRCSSESLGTALPKQFFQKPFMLYLIGGVLFLFGCMNGMPKLVMFFLSIVFTGFGFFLSKEEKKHHSTLDQEKQDMFFSPIELIVPRKESYLEEMLHHLRGKILSELGVLTQPVVLRESEALKDQWILKIKGVVVLEEKISLHSTQIIDQIKKSLHLLLTRQDVAVMVDNAREYDSAVVDELFFKKINYGQMLKVLQNLLKEQIPINDFVSILESCADAISGQKKIDIDYISEKVRESLSSRIAQFCFPNHEKAYIITIDPQVESMLELSFSKKEGQEKWTLKPKIRQSILHKIQDANKKTKIEPIIITSITTRQLWKKFFEIEKIDLKVFSYKELSHSLKLEVIEEISSDVLI